MPQRSREPFDGRIESSQRAHARNISRNRGRNPRKRSRGFAQLAALCAASLLAAAALPTAATAPPTVDPSEVIAPPRPEVLRFGESVASHHDRLLIAAPTDGDAALEPGSVTLLRFAVDSKGQVVRTTEGEFNATRVGDHFACSVALGRGTAREQTMARWTAAVGADRATLVDRLQIHHEDYFDALGESGGGFEGCVDLFELRPEPDGSFLWKPIATITAPRPQVGAEFGSAVDFAPSGDLLAVAARRHDLGDLGGLTDAGCINLFEYSNTQPREASPDSAAPLLRHLTTHPWSHTQTLCAPAPQSAAWFGSAVACGEAWIAVGAPGENSSDSASNGGITTPDAGAVHLFARAANGRFVFERTIWSPTATSFGSFGAALALDGTTLVVGEFGGRIDGVACGKAWIFDLEDPTNPPQELRPPDRMTGLAFGQSVAIDGADILVGAAGFDAPGPEAEGDIEDCGRAYLYARWSGAHTATLLAPALTPMGLFSISLAFVSAESSDATTSARVAACGHLYVEEESFGPSPGVALYRPPVSLTEQPDTTWRASTSNPVSVHNR